MPNNQWSKRHPVKASIYLRTSHTVTYHSSPILKSSTLFTVRNFPKFYFVKYFDILESEFSMFGHIFDASTYWIAIMTSFFCDSNTINALNGRDPESHRFVRLSFVFPFRFLLVSYGRGSRFPLLVGISTTALRNFLVCQLLLGRGCLFAVRKVWQCGIWAPSARNDFQLLEQSKFAAAMAGP